MSLAPRVSNRTSLQVIAAFGQVQQRQGRLGVPGPDLTKRGFSVVQSLAQILIRQAGIANGRRHAPRYVLLILRHVRLY